MIGKIWNATLAVNISNTNQIHKQNTNKQGDNTQEENNTNGNEIIFNTQCDALIKNLEDLKKRALYRKFFISNITDEYVNQNITFGQFKRVLEKYETLLKETPTEEQSITTILQTIRKAMNSNVERQIAMKVFVEYLKQRYTNNTTINNTGTNTMSSFADVSLSNSFAPHIEQAYKLCLVHGRKTRDGNPEDPNQPRIFEPTSYITIAETIKVLVNM